MIRLGAPSGWQHSAAARTAHALTALVATSGAVTSLYLGWTTDTELPDGVGYSGGFSAGWEHLLNQPAYFTVLSGFLVMVTSWMLAVRTYGRSAVFHIVRLAALVQMIITGLVFNLLLRDGAEMEGVQLYNDWVQHQILPVMVPLVWLIFGPWGRITGRVVAGSMLISVAWLAVTLLRGPGLDWYPIRSWMCRAWATTASASTSAPSWGSTCCWPARTGPSIGSSRGAADVDLPVEAALSVPKSPKLAADSAEFGRLRHVRS